MKAVAAAALALTLLVNPLQTNQVEAHTWMNAPIEEITEEVKTTGTIQVEEYFWVDYGPFEITAYCSCEKCCGIWSQYQGLTASGAPIQEGVTISVDPNVIPLGTEVEIVFADGTSHTYIAQDTGSAIKGNIIDLYFGSHERACQFGRQTCHVYIRELNDPRN